MVEVNMSIDSVSNQDNNNNNNNNNNLFNSLFGEIPAGNEAVSLFSADNPFRRKPYDSSQESSNRQKEESWPEVSGKTDVGLETSDGSSEMKKKTKRKKDGNGDSVVEATTLSEENEPVGSKKLKRVDLEDFQSGKERSSGGKDFNLGSKENLKSDDGKVKEVVERHDIEKKNEKKKNKRKRGEVEAEYEAKKYGVAEQEQEEEKGKGGGVIGRKRKEMENVEDFDDESKLLRTVFVGNLPLKIKKKVLVKEFGKFGEVESMRIRSVPLTDSKVPRKGAVIKQQFNEAASSVHAYVVFRTEESAQASLAHNMSVVGGNHIRVDRACPPRKKLKGGDAPLYDNRRTVFVGNLPFDVKDEELYQLFNNIKDLESSIEAIRVIRHPGTSMGKGIAYVLFKTREAANMAARKHRLKLRDRELRLAHSKADATPSKRKAPMQPEINQSTAKKFAVKVGYSDKENSVKLKAPLSYQGLRGSKSGNLKKTYTKNHVSRNVVPKLKERMQKRPAVAARKTEEAGLKRKSEKQTPDSKVAARKAKVRKTEEAGLKRKSEKHTPDSNGRQKKARKFK